MDAADEDEDDDDVAGCGFGCGSIQARAALLQQLASKGKVYSVYCCLLQHLGATYCYYCWWCCCTAELPSGGGCSAMGDDIYIHTYMSYPI